MRAERFLDYGGGSRERWGLGRVFYGELVDDLGLFFALSPGCYFRPRIFNFQNPRAASPAKRSERITDTVKK